MKKAKKKEHDPVEMLYYGLMCILLAVIASVGVGFVILFFKMVFSA